MCAYCPAALPVMEGVGFLAAMPSLGISARSFPATRPAKSGMQRRLLARDENVQAFLYLALRLSLVSRVVFVTLSLSSALSSNALAVILSTTTHCYIISTIP